LFARATSEEANLARCHNTGRLHTARQFQFALIQAFILAISGIFVNEIQPFFVIRSSTECCSELFRSLLDLPLARFSSNIPKIRFIMSQFSPARWNPLRRILAPVLAAMLAGVAQSQLPDASPAPPPNQPPELTPDGPDKKLLFSTTLVEARSADGKQTRTGTGFVYNHDLGNHRGILFIVTCRHLLDGLTSATLSFVQRQNGKPDPGHICRVPVDNLPELAFYDPDPRIDLAIIPVKPLLQRFYTNTQIPYFQTLDNDLIPNRQTAESLGAIQRLVFAGYPAGLRDELHLLPLAQAGFTASPYVVDFDGLPVFLIDARVPPGTSGSPVVVLDHGADSTPVGATVAGRLHFLGVLSDAYFRTTNGKIQFRPPPPYAPTAEQPDSWNMGVVVKPAAILDTISEYLKIHPFTAPDDSDAKKTPARN
jgi:hypothetical protein